MGGLWLERGGYRGVPCNIRTDLIIRLIDLIAVASRKLCGLCEGLGREGEEDQWQGKCVEHFFLSSLVLFVGGSFSFVEMQQDVRTLRRAR